MALTPVQQSTLTAIKTAAAAHNVDWRVMAALSHHESNLGASTYGDNGHAIGPFQLNNAGGVLTGTTPQEFKSYANADKNADYAATALAKLGITRGSGTVQSQIAQGVNRFERPANKGAEIADATQWYNSTLAGSNPGAVTTPAAGAPQVQQGLQPQAQTPLQNQRLNLLSYTMQNTPQARASGAAPSLQNLLSSALTATTSGVSATATSLPTQSGKQIPVKIDPGIVPDTKTAGVISVAERYLNTPYHFGGADPKSGFDCSGLLQYSYKQMGINIPRTTYQQIKAGTAVKSAADLQPGDAIFFNKGEHVGMYIGNGQFIQAPHTGDVVKISKLQGYDGGIYAMRRFTKGG